MKVKCEVCGIDGYLQTLGSYHRIRHYVGIDPITKKSKFSYCPQTKEYLNRILASQPLANTDHLTTGIDLKLSVSNSNNGVEPRAGIEPATYSLQGVQDDFWPAFEKWVKEKAYRGSWSNTVITCARKYSDSLFTRDLSNITALPDTARPNVLKALSSLAKFMGIHEEFKQLIRNYGLKWSGRSSDDLIIDRFNKVKKPDEVFLWIKKAKDLRPELTEFLDFMALTGLRMIEAVASYNLIIKLSYDKKLKEYYNSKTRTLEHFRYKDLFIRKSKKAFISFVPEDLVQEISEQTPVTLDMIRKRIQKENLPLRFSDIREAHGTFLTKFLKESEVDFLHGRTSSSVFMRNYFNPALIQDLEARAFQAIAELIEKVKG